MENPSSADNLRATAWRHTINASDKIAKLFEQNPVDIPHLLGPYMATAVFSNACSQVVAEVFSVDPSRNQLATRNLDHFRSILKKFETWWCTDQTLQTRLSEVIELLHWWRDQMPIV